MSGGGSRARRRSMAWGGRHLVIGFAAGAIPKVCHLALSASHLPTVPPDAYATVRTPRSRSTSACSKALQSSACTAAFPDPGRVACAFLIPNGFHGVLKLSLSSVPRFWGVMTMKEPERNAVHLKEILALYSAGKIRPVAPAFPYTPPAPPPPPPPSRTDWTCLVPPPVLTGHVSPLLTAFPYTHPLHAQHSGSALGGPERTCWQ